MASRLSLRVLLVCCLLSHWSRALQVTPNSPCAPLCMDSTSLDPSDPTSSTTKNSDITCQDKEYGSSPAGIKFKSCMSCLQNSTYSQGSENDQMWFLYNLRYSLSFCIFGFPNATDATTSPCLTSFACEPLTHPLEDGIISPSSSTQYGYCSIDGNVANHQSFSRCASCISAGGHTQYLANYLVALDAGCAQTPAPGHVLGLNGSVFSPTAIGIVDPAVASPTGTPNSGSSGLPPGIIAAIISVVVIILLIAAAFFFIRFKKRQNRRKRASYALKYKVWGGSSSSHSQMPQSPLSFQCKTQMGPTSPKFFDDNSDPASTTASLSRQPSLRRQPSFQAISAVTETPSHPLPRRESSFSHQSPLQYHPFAHQPITLHSLNTNPSALPSYPNPTHASPLSSSQARFSPDSYYTVTPTSAVSTRSNAPLLPPYIPAQHAAVPSLRGPHNITTTSPVATTSPTVTTQTPTYTTTARTTTTTTTSPLLRDLPTFTRDTTTNPRDSSSPTQPPPAPPPKSPRMVVGVAIDGVEGLVNFKVPRGSKVASAAAAGTGARGKKKDSGSPVESRTVVSVFPPPPPPLSGGRR